MEVVFFFTMLKNLDWVHTIYFIWFDFFFIFTLFRECFKFENRIIKIYNIFLGESKLKFEFLGS